MPIEQYMLPCLWHKLFGVCCLSCGLQRSVVAMVQGRIVDSVSLYPALLPMMLTALLFVLSRTRWGHRLKKPTRAMAIATLTIMVVGCVLKNCGVLPQ